MISQVTKNLEAEDGPDVSQLRQQKLLLSEKLDILSKLDEELIDMVKEDDLDTEVEQADLIRERIRMCLITIDDVLECRTRVTPRMKTPPITPTVSFGLSTPPTTESSPPLDLQAQRQCPMCRCLH